MAKAFDVDTGGTLTTGLVGWYNLESNSNDEFSTNHGTDVNTPTFSSGNGKINNGAGYVKASSQRSDLPNAVIPWGTAAFSVSLFFKRDATGNTQWMVLGSQTTASGNGGFYITYGIDAAGALSANKVNVVNSNPQYAWTQNTNWHHVVIVCRSSGTGMELYFDGVSVATATSTANVIDSANPVAIGARHIGTPDFYFDGAVDLVGFWNKALSATEIADLYNSGNGNAYREQPATNKGRFFAMFS